jgi:hypothetical protein
MLVVEDISRNKCFSPMFEYHMFYVLYPFMTHSVVGIAASCWLYDLGVGVKSPGVGKNFLHVVQTGSGAYPVGTVGFPLG